MKKFFKFIVYRPIITLFIFIIIFFLPAAIAAQPQSYNKLIVKALAIDKLGDEYEVSVYSYVPKATQTFSENYKFISSKGKSFFDAISNITNLTGRIVALAQSDLIFLNSELCEEGIIQPLDYLVRRYSLRNNSIILNTGNTPAKDVLEAAGKMFKSSGIYMENISTFNEDKIFATRINLEKVFSATYSPSKALLLGVIELKDESGIEISNESGSEPGQSSEPEQGSGGAKSSEEEKKLANEGKAIVIKNGKKVLDLSYPDIEALGWARNKYYNGNLFIENFTDENFTNADIGLTIFQNSVVIATKFEGDKPVCEISVNPLLMIVEVEQEKFDPNIYISEKTLETPKLDQAIISKISNDLSSVMKKLVFNNIDLLSIYENFYANHTEKFKDFISKLPNPDNYILEIEFRFIVNPS